jgi:hypothetical protein
VLSALRSWLLGDPAVAAAVGPRVQISRADVAGVVPAIALELSGGPGTLNAAMDQVEISVHAWSSTSWAEALGALGAAIARLRGATHASGLSAPLLAVTSVGAPRQVSELDYYHAQMDVTCIVRGAA